MRRANVLAELKACASTRNLSRGQQIHEAAIRNGDASDVWIANTLINMYAKCGSFGSAQDVFERMQIRTTASWSALIMGYAENGDGDWGLELFARMHREGCAPHSRTFVAALKACREDVGIAGKAVHLLAERSGQIDIFVQNTLLDMYAKAGMIGDAWRVFGTMDFVDLVSWNALILGYAENGKGETALVMFSRMDYLPDTRTFVAAFKACSGIAEEDNANGAEEKGRVLHLLASSSGCDSDVYVANTLVGMYAKFKALKDARRVFDGMQNRTVLSWTVLMVGYAECGESKLCLDLFWRMRVEGYVQDGRTIVAALKACTLVPECGGVDNGKAIHLLAASTGLDSNMYVEGTLLDMYVKGRALREAYAVFSRMTYQDVLSWTALLVGYAEAGENAMVLALFSRMGFEGCAPDARTFLPVLSACTGLAGRNVDCEDDEDGFLQRGQAVHMVACRSACCSNTYVESTLVDMYAKWGRMEDARYVFDGMQERTVVSWTALILGYVNSSEGCLVLELFERLKREGCEPDAVTFVAAVKACAMVGAMALGRRIHAEIRSRGLENDGILANCLLDFYAKCGSLAEAKKVFDSHASKDLITWNALITGYTHHGNSESVFDMFDRMQDVGLHPDGITFRCVLTACSHAGLVDRGWNYFVSMSKFGIKPNVEHYTCLADMLARSNRLDEAMVLLRSMHLSPTSVTWTVVLEACRKWKNLLLAKLAFESLTTLDTKNSGTYVLMASAERSMLV